MKPISLENHPTDGGFKIVENEISQTLASQMGTGGNNTPMVLETEREEYPQMIVRRLTPLECERLQNLPDGWTDIGDWVDSNGRKRKGDSDAPRYKALGNSIALCWWQKMANKMVKQLKDDGEEEPTMASLFDGISGFCLVYARAGCKPVWSSEVEDFCIAVAKKHFGDEEKGIKGDIEKYL